MLESADQSVAVTDATEAAVGAPPPTPDREGVLKRKLPFGAWLSIGWLVIIFGAAILAPWLPLKDPNGGTDVDFLNAGKGWATAGHIFGVDDNGRDVLSRVIWGARASLTIAVGSILFATIVGGLLGLIAGYKRGSTDTVLTSSFNIMLAFPQLILALTLVSVFSPVTDQSQPTWSDRVKWMIIAIGIVSIPVLARITRANALVWAQREFVMAARAQGAKSMSVMFREVLPNVLPAILSISLLGVAVVIVVEGGLALFGLSVVLPDPTWGNMIAAEIGTLDNVPHVWLTPAIAIILTVLSFNYLGDVVRTRFDVRESAL